MGERLGAWNRPEGVRFRLLVPGAQRVSVVGDFNGWDGDVDPMEREDAGVWSCTRELPEGEHPYGFCVDGTIVADPLARWVRRGDLGMQSVIRVGADELPWSEERPDPRPLEQVVIYELHVGTFSEEGSFDAVTARLDELVELGVTALQLMPVAHAASEPSWGYDPIFWMAPALGYGDREALARLVDAAHQRGLAVFLDVVFNHVTGAHPLAALHDVEDSPFFQAGDNPWGFVDLDFGSEATRWLLCEVQRYWLWDLRIDGLRYDAAGFIGPDGMHFLADDARRHLPEVCLIGEFDPEQPDMVAGSGLDAGWGIHLSRSLQEALVGGSVGCELVELAFSARSQGYPGALARVSYLESHDETRFARLVAQSEVPDEQKLARSLLGHALLMTLPGLPMVYQGQELATLATKDESMQGHAIAWEALADETLAGHRACFGRLVALRRDHEALWSEQVGLLSSEEELDEGLVGYRRCADEGDGQVVVWVNLGLEAREVELPEGRWCDVVTGEEGVSELAGSGCGVWVRVG